MSNPTIRMYVDENGHQSLKGDLSLPDKRFLCMTGIIMTIHEHDVILTKRLNELKLKYFNSTEIILHRREIISASGNFSCLKDDDIRAAFNNDFLCIVKDTNYRVISVVIDKKALVERYGILKAKDPYALSLEYLMQRYQYWMQDYKRKFGNCKGDILAEARGGGEDRLTKETYHEIYLGRGYNELINASEFYSSSQIKLKPKTSNIAGLQFADLVSHPSRRYILSTNGLAVNLKSSSFEQSIVDILVESKFRRTNGMKNGVIDGAGTILFPKA